MCRLCNHLERAQLQKREVLHAPAFSAQRRAHYLHESGRRVVKSVLIEGEDRRAIVLLPASSVLDYEMARQELGVDQLRFVGPQLIHDSFPECEIGVVPGFGAPFGIPVLVDAPLREEPYLLIPGWTSCISYRLDANEYDRLENPRWVRIGISPLTSGFPHPEVRPIVDPSPVAPPSL
jgi:Ala-tRNA(Pro) deacylase